MVKNIQVRKQQLAGMEAYPPAKPELLPEFFADELVGKTDLVARFRSDFDAPTTQAALEKILQQNHGDATCEYNLGCIFAARSDWQRAVECFGRARNAVASPVLDQAQHQLRRVGGWVTEAASRRRKVPAMFTLGMMYDKGWGPARDVKAAKLWYRNAANGGDAHAMTRLATLYGEDLEAATDPKSKAWYQDEMLSMYRQAAKLNDEEAKLWLAQHDKH